MREAIVKALLLDPVHNTPVILLKDQDSDMVMPVWIGSPEATAIAMELQQKDFPRPLTHDLLKGVILSLDASLKKVIIDEIHDGTYYATLFIQGSDGVIQEIDARPSDSVALALRMGCPIYIAEEVFETSAIEMPIAEDEEISKEEFQDFIEKEMNLSDFKKFIQ